MEIIAKQTYVRGGQQKLTDVTRVLKKMSVAKMRLQLTQMNKHAAKRILETLNQAVANAQNNHGISEDKLKLKELLILRGPHYKRMRAVSRGMGHAILKRTSHIVVRLESVEGESVKEQPTTDQQPMIDQESKEVKAKARTAKSTKEVGTKTKVKKLAK